MTYDQVHEALKQVVKESQDWHAESREKLVDWEARRIEMAAKRLHEILSRRKRSQKRTITVGQICPSCENDVLAHYVGPEAPFKFCTSCGYKELYELETSQ